MISPTFGTAVSYTNANGEFSGRVPKNQSLTLNISLICDTINDWALALTEIVSSGLDSIVGEYTASLSSLYPISGTIVNCVGLPVNSGYVKMGPLICLAENGVFTIQTCSIGEFVFRGFDNSDPDSIKASTWDTVLVGTQGINIGELTACLDVYGIVSDINGNVYPTVLIGNQWWMAENLKTTQFADGSEITNVTDNTAWAQLNTPALCSFENNESYDTLLGKLYNWYTTVDPRNACPLGWHIPTDSDWTVLTDYLGGEGVAGGKMKSTSGWDTSNVIATNESGFSCLPGGPRVNGNFCCNDGGSGAWWSSSGSTSVNAWARAIYSTYNYVLRGDGYKVNGYYIRCLKD